MIEIIQILVQLNYHNKNYNSKITIMVIVKQKYISNKNNHIIIVIKYLLLIVHFFPEKFLLFLNFNVL